MSERAIYVPSDLYDRLVEKAKPALVLSAGTSAKFFITWRRPRRLSACYAKLSPWDLDKLMREDRIGLGSPTEKLER